LSDKTSQKDRLYLDGLYAYFVEQDTGKAVKILKKTGFILMAYMLILSSKIREKLSRSSMSYSRNILMRNGLSIYRVTLSEKMATWTKLMLNTKNGTSSTRRMYMPFIISAGQVYLGRTLRKRKN
jgi:hypothetical protein